ncbi:MAG: hypothetical protein ACTHV1_07145 [Flaviflexus sp.]|uniref:hypothetical protein n=1 Tax=Flaviflexus sp. TaxID=1969482 RepID=UPI003F8EB761
MGYSRKSGTAALPLPQTSPSPAVSDFSSSFTNVGGAIGETQVVAMGPQIQSWLGEAAEAYSQESLDIQSKAVSLQGILSDISTQVSNYGETYQTLVDTTIPDYQQQWDDAITTHDENVEATEAEMETARQNTPEGETFDASSFLTEIERQHDLLEETQDDLALYYNQAVTSVDEAAGSTASAIAGLIDGFVPRGKNGALPTRTEVASALFGDSGGLLEAQASFEAAVEDAPDAAEILSDVDENGIPTEAALQEFNDLYGDRLANDPFFATAFYNEYGVTDINEFFTRVSSPNRYVSPEHQALIDETVSNFGAGLILATGGTNEGYENNDAWVASNQGMGFGLGDHDNLGDWREQFQGEIIDAGRATWDTEGRTDDNSSYGTPGYVAMMQAMGIAGENNSNLAVGDSFLNGPNSVAHDLVAWDQETQYNWSTHGTSWSTLEYDMDGNHVIDPLQNMLSVIDGTGAPAQTWLTSDTSFTFDHDHNDETDDASMNMTRYLTGHRPISHLTGQNWPDQGDTLGELLNEATVLDPQSETSTTIALNFMEGYTDGLAVDYDTWWPGNQDRVNGEDVFGHHNSGLRSWAGYVLDDYMEDIADGIVTPSSTTGVIENPDGTYKLMINDQLRDQLIGGDATDMFTDLAFHSPEQNEDGTWVGGRPPALNTLIDRSLIEMNLDLVDAMGENGSDGMIHNANSNWGSVLEALTTSSADADTAVAEAVDERNSYLQGLVNKGVGAIPFSEILTTSGQKYVQGQVDNLGILDMGLEAALPTDNAAQAQVHEIDAHNAVEVLVREQFYSAVSQTTYWEGGPAPADTFGPGANLEYLNMLDEDGNFIPYSDMDATQRLQFEEWVTNYNYGAGERFDEHVHDIEANLNDAQQEGEE